MSLIEGLWDPGEWGWTMRRPARNRVPLPAAGDHIWYRHRHFGPITQARVRQVQPIPEDDFDYQWLVVRNDAGMPLIDGAGHRVVRPTPDPWITLRLATDWGLVDTREARLCGSAGWLPVDWASRLYPRATASGLTFVRQEAS